MDCTFREVRSGDIPLLITADWPGASVVELKKLFDQEGRRRPESGRDTLLIAEKDGRIIGYVHYWDTSSDPDEYELEALAVDPALPADDAAALRAMLEKSFREAGW